jgi:hypothetical protein
MARLSIVQRRVGLLRARSQTSTGRGRSTIRVTARRSLADGLARQVKAWSPGVAGPVRQSNGCSTNGPVACRALEREALRWVADPSFVQASGPADDQAPGSTRSPLPGPFTLRDKRSLDLGCRSSAETSLWAWSGSSMPRWPIDPIWLRWWVPRTGRCPHRRGDGVVKGEIHGRLTVLRPPGPALP